MKKATLLAFAFAMFAGAQSIVAQEPAENVQYVSDPSQGVLLNRMQDNWFITAEGGANIYFSHKSIHRDLSDRFSPAASIYAGKWFTPVFGARAGVTWMQLKGLADGPDFMGTLKYDYRPDGFYKQRTQEIGPVFDLMVNLTNWWCGYKPNRVYNASVYVGAGALWTISHQDGSWKNAHNILLNLRAGLINTFNVSKQVALSLDIRWTGIDGLQNVPRKNWNEKYSDLSAFIGVTYKFKNREWNAPVVPVYPEPENCEPIRARLAAANERIDELERALRDCLNRPVETTVVNEGPLATVYYTIGVSRLSRENQRVVKAVAAQMNSDKYANTNFVLTGWADNYTGTEAINARLRAKRAEGVKDLLVRSGVDASRLSVAENSGNRMGEGDQFVALDRAVTIEEAR
jgi:outer membrane protein OmpA-like peptidoglycan-associated protein